MQLVTIIGFGSLLSPRSALTTFPRLLNFRTGRVYGWRRVFAHVGIIFIEKGIAEKGSNEIASVAAEPAEGHSLLVSVFELPLEDYPAFQKREDFFKLTEVPVHELKELPWPDDVPQRQLARGVMCASFANDDELIATNFGGAKQQFYDRFQTWYSGEVYRTDILPCRVYLKHCLVAAERLGPQFHANFLDVTFIGDRQTTIREYLRQHPTLLDSVQFGKFDRYQG